LGISNWYGPTWQEEQILSITASTGATSNAGNGGTGLDYLLDGSLNLTISGSTHEMVFTFTDATDYYVYKNSYTGATASANWAKWVSDSTDINHYQTFIAYQKISMTSGDTYTTIAPYIDHEAVFVFDDVNYKISIDLVSQTNEYPSVACSTIRSSIDSQLITYINSWYSGYTESYDTIWGRPNPFYFRYFTPNLPDTSVTSWKRAMIYSGQCQTCGYDFLQTPTHFTINGYLIILLLKYKSQIQRIQKITLKYIVD